MEKPMNDQISQGAKANLSGQTLEKDTASILSALGIDFETQVIFEDCYNNSRSKMDFYIPELDCAIECKRQNVSGTADQKLPFVVENLKKFPSVRGLVVLDGSHYQNRKGIHDYLNSIKSSTLDWCFAHHLGEWLIEQTNIRKTS